MYRLAVDAAGEDDWVSSDNQSMARGLRLVVCDTKNWILVFVVYGAASSTTINSFFPTVVKSFGFGDIETLLLTSPPYLLACAACVAVSWSADRTGERYWHTVGPLAAALAGLVVACAATGAGARYFGAAVMMPGIYAGFNMSMVWTANTSYRPPAKRAAAVALNNAVSTLSGIYSSYLYPSNAGPRYVLAFGVNAGMSFMAIVAATLLKLVLTRENRKLELREQQDEQEGRRNAIGPGFRYLV